MAVVSAAVVGAPVVGAPVVGAPAANVSDDADWDLQQGTPMPDYDWNETMYYYDWAELAPPLVVYSLTLLLGLAGNSLIILTTLRFRRMQSTTNVFLSSLALADLLLIIVCIPVKVTFSLP